MKIRQAILKIYFEGPGNGASDDGDCQPPRQWEISIEEGIETARLYLNSSPNVVGFHHSDLDPYEAKQRAGKTPPSRYDSFEYVELLQGKLGGFGGLLVPHRVVVYQTRAGQN